MGSGLVLESEVGVFYVLQLVPELDPKRIKLGFAVDLNDRLLEHRAGAPTAKVLKSWPCKRSWGATAVDCLSSICCRHVRHFGDVFQCDDLGSLLKRGEEFFRILPDVRRKPER